MSSLRRENHLETLAFLGRLERDGAKALQAPVFSAYGGQGYGNAGGHYGSPIWQPWQPGSKYDYQAEAGDLWRNSAVACCLAWYADNFPEPEMRVMRRNDAGDEDPVPDHPLIRLLRNPNPYQTWHTIAKGLVLSYRTDGNAYLMVAKGPAYDPGDPIQLWWMPHYRVWPRWDTTGDQYLGWWDYQVDGRIIHLDPDQVIHFRDGVDPYYDRLGLAALKSLLREVCTDNSAAGFTAAIMRNMGVIGYAISPANPEDTFGDKVDRDEMAKSFQERFLGEGRGKVLVNSRGVKVDKIGMSPEELALDRIMKIPESRICAAMRLPAMVVGLAVGSEQRTFANYAEARRAAYEDGIIPMQKEIAATINRRLMPLLGDPLRERFEFDYSNVQCMSESEDARFKRFGEAYQKNRIITLNQALTATGHEPVPGGDKFADGSTPQEGPRVPPAPAMPGAVPTPSSLTDPDDAEQDGPAAKSLRAEAMEVLKLARERMGAA